MSKVMTEEDFFQEVADALEKEEKKKSEIKPQQGGLKLTAEAVTRKITEAEFEKLFFNLTAEEKRKVRSDLILDDKLDPFEDSKHKEKVKVMTDEEIDRLALDY